MKQLAFALVGVLVGWMLKVWTDVRTARRERERHAAERLHDALSDIWRGLRGRGSFQVAAIDEERDRFRQAWWRYAPRVSSEKVRERVRSAGQMLWLAGDLADFPDTRDLAIDRAIRNAQVALNAFIEHRWFGRAPAHAHARPKLFIGLPPACFPSPEDTLELLWGAASARDGAATLHAWMEEHPHGRVGRGPWIPAEDNAPEWSWIRPSVSEPGATGRVLQDSGEPPG